MSLKVEMREESNRELFDGGDFALPERAAKLPAPATSLKFVEPFGWKLDKETKTALPIAVHLMDEYAVAQRELVAAEERMSFWDRDRTAFDAAAVVEAGTFSGVELWDREAPDTVALAYKVEVLRVAADVAKRDFVRSVAADPKFVEKCDLVWENGVMSADEDAMTGRELRHYLVAASTIRQHLLALVMLHGAGVGMVPDEQKRLRQAFKEDSPRCPTVPRIRATLAEDDLARAAAVSVAEKEVRVKREAEAAMAASYRSGQEKLKENELAADGQEK